MSKAPKILNYKNIAYEKYEYGQPFKQPNGVYQSMCHYRLSKNEVLPFYFETPKLKTVSGIVKIDNKYYMDLELPQSGDASSGFYNYLLKTDEHNITVCHQNSKDWFNQYMPLDIVESYYKSPVILRTNGQLPVMRVRLPSYKGNILTEIYNIKKEKVNDILCISADDYIVGIVEFIGLAFMSQSFTPIYELQKIKIFKENDQRTLPSGYIFSDFNDKVDIDKLVIPEDEERILAEPPPTDKPIHTPIYTPIYTPIPIKQIKEDNQVTIPLSSNKFSNTNPIANTNNLPASTINKTEQTLTSLVPVPLLLADQLLTTKTVSIDKSPISIPTLKHAPTSTIEITKNRNTNKISDINTTNTNNNGLTLFDMVKKSSVIKDMLIDDDIFIQHSRGLKSAYKQREVNLREYLQKKQKSIVQSNIHTPTIPNSNQTESNNNGTTIKIEYELSRSGINTQHTNTSSRNNQPNIDNIDNIDNINDIDIILDSNIHETQIIDNQIDTININNNDYINMVKDKGKDKDQVINNEDMEEEGLEEEMLGEEDLIQEEIGEEEMLGEEDLIQEEIGEEEMLGEEELDEEENDDLASDDGIDYKILNDLEVVIFED